MPCLVLLAVGILAGRRTRALSTRVTTRFGTGEVREPSVVAVPLMLLGLLIALLPFWLLR